MIGGAEGRGGRGWGGVGWRRVRVHVSIEQ